MGTLIACWNRTRRSRSVWTAAGIAVCLAGILELVQAPFQPLRGSASPRNSASEVGGVAVQLRPAARVLPSSPADVRPDAPKAALPDRVLGPLALAPVVSHPVLVGVAQLALAASQPERVMPVLEPAEDANAKLLRQHFARLKSGREQFGKIAGYSATMVKQERIGSLLLDEASLSIKVRHQPFSVYMRWESGDETGKEVLYVEGNNDGQLLVRLGGLKGRILPALKIDPFGSLALRQSRYPITKLGILALADTLIERRELEVRDKIVPRVEQRPDADCGGRPCSVYAFEVSDSRRSPVYRKSVQYIDRQWNVPLRVANYSWPEPGQRLQGAALDEATLIEYYIYSEIVADARLTDADFDRDNADYRFHR